MPTFDDRLNGAVALSWDRAEFVTRQKAAQYDDGSFSVRWKVPEGLIEESIQWLNTNRGSATDISVRHKTFSGTWRSVAVVHDTVRVRSAGGDELIHYVVQTFSYGWAETIKSGSNVDWTLSRLVEKFYNYASASAANFASLANSSTDAPEEFLLVRFANLKRTKLKSIQSEVSEASYTNPAIGGETHSGVWHPVVTHGQAAEDGSAFLDVLLAKPQYTLTAFQDSNTSREQTVGYLWQVPKDLAQGIITAWDSADAAGRSASATYSKDGRLVDLVLTGVVGTDNLSTPWVQVSCDRWRRWHFAWGYTKAQVYTDADPDTGFIPDHDTAIGTLDPDPGGKVIRSRTVNVSVRGDGLYDVIIVEDSFATDDFTAPAMTVTVFSGTKNTVAHTYGYNLALSDFSISAFTTLFATTYKAVGKTTRIEITREDDCSFDYHATVTTLDYDTDSVSINIGETAGLGLHVSEAIHMNTTELASLVGGFSSDARTQHNIDIEILDDETRNATIVERKVQEKYSSRTAGDATVYSGVNVDDDNIADFGAAGTAVLRYASFQHNDDGTSTYTVLTNPLHADTFAVSDDAALSNRTYVQQGFNQSSVPTPTGAEVLAARINEGDNGRYNYTLISRDVEAVSKTGINYGTTNTAATLAVGYQVATGDVPTTAPAAGQEVVTRATPMSNGRFTYDRRVITHGEQLAYAKAVSAFGDIQITVHVFDVQNTTAEPNDFNWATKFVADWSADYDPALLDSGYRKRIEGFQYHDYDRYSFRLVVTAVDVSGMGEKTIASSNFTDKRKDVVYARFNTFSLIYSAALRSYQRIVTMTRVRTYSATIPSASGATDGQLREVIEVIPELVYALQTTTINYGEWTDGTLSTIDVTVT